MKNPFRRGIDKGSKLEQLLKNAPTPTTNFEEEKQRRENYVGSGLVANSVFEEDLYITLQTCKCGGFHQKIRQSLRPEGKEGPYYDNIDAKCTKCGAEKEFVFDVTRFFGDPRFYGKINPFDRPSSIVDIVDWSNITLKSIMHFKMKEAIIKKASRKERESMRQEQKYTLDRVLELIDEQLKFYPAGAKFPDRDAFFNNPEISGEEKNTYTKERVLKLKDMVENKMYKEVNKELAGKSFRLRHGGSIGAIILSLLLMRACVRTNWDMLGEDYIKIFNTYVGNKSETRSKKIAGVTQVQLSQEELKAKTTQNERNLALSLSNWETYAEKRLEELIKKNEYIPENPGFNEKNVKIANSIREAYLSIFLTGIQNPSHLSKWLPVKDEMFESEGRFYDRVSVKCMGCNSEKEFIFDITEFYLLDQEHYDELNPLNRTSVLIDITQWAILSKLGALNIEMDNVIFAETGKEFSKTKIKKNIDRALVYINEGLRFFQKGRKYALSNAFFNPRRSVDMKMFEEYSIDKFLGYRSEIESKFGKLEGVVDNSSIAETNTDKNEKTLENLATESLKSKTDITPVEATEPDSDFELEKKRRASYEGKGLVVNSVNEEYVYIKLQEHECGGSYEGIRGLKGFKPGGHHKVIDGIHYDLVDAECTKCGSKKEFSFDISRFYGDLRLYSLTNLNPFDRPSSVIDLNEWFRLINSEIRNTKDENKTMKEKVVTSLNIIMYATEALKFYHSESESPSEDAFFNSPGITEAGRKRVNREDLIKLVKKSAYSVFKTELERQLKEGNITQEKYNESKIKLDEAKDKIDKTKY